MASGSGVRWVLAFDASCATCVEVSNAVARACDNKLEVLALTHRDVVAWRERALGPKAAWAPTLIKVSERGVRAWTRGAGMGVHLVLRLGPRSMVRVLGALGDLERTPAASEPVTEEPDRTVMGRARFLRLAVGASAALGFVVLGKTPAFAAAKSPAKQWVKANKGRLPQTYDQVIVHPMSYRREIYGELTPAARGKLWIEQFARYRTANPGLTAEQRKVLDRAAAFASDESTFTNPAGVERSLVSFGSDAERAFGKDEVYAIFGRLGPAAEESPAQHATPDGCCPSCNCNSTSAWPPGGWCGAPCNCQTDPGTCFRSSSGCGFLWNYPCDSMNQVGACYYCG